MPHHVHRMEGIGARVLINGNWHKLQYDRVMLYCKGLPVAND